MNKAFQAGKLAYDNQEFAKAFALLLPVAEHGFPYAQFLVGKLLFAGLEIKQDLKQAASWFLKAAANNFALAQYEVGKLYENGICFELKHDQALAWYTKAEKNDHAAARERLKLIHQKNQTDEAIVSAATSKDKVALYTLATRQITAKGEKQDLQAALTNLKSAAGQGLAEAQYELGQMFSKGEGMPQNHLQALGYFRSAAKQGHASAQYQLGLIFEKGQAIPADKIAALALFMLSKINGNPQPISPTPSSEEWKPAKTLLGELMKPGNFLSALEQRKEHGQHQKIAITTAMWTGYTAGNTSKKSAKKQGSSRLYRRFLFVIAFMVIGLLMRLPSKSPAQQSYDKNACAAPPFTSTQALLQAKEEAQTEGYEINEELRCIDKKSYELWQAEKQANEQRQAEKLTAKRQELATEGKSDLAQARFGFETTIKYKDPKPLALPQPPTELFVRSDYKNTNNYWLPGFISPDPKDGQRHPAIIWLAGGDTNSLSDFWVAGPDENDQSARAFREAGMIMYFPTLRGGNFANNEKEFLLGEVEDVLAAAEQLKKLNYIDPDAIYLGGHSTGGTLALLTAAMKTPFKAIFAFGPVSQADRYPSSLIPIQFGNYDPMELKLRSPINWLSGIDKPTYVIEGKTGTNNSDELEKICAASDNYMLHCIRIQNADHFSVLHTATHRIAKKLSDPRLTDISFTPEEFNQ